MRRIINYLEVILSLPLEHGRSHTACDRGCARFSVIECDVIFLLGPKDFESPGPRELLSLPDLPTPHTSISYLI